MMGGQRDDEDCCGCTYATTCESHAAAQARADENYREDRRMEAQQDHYYFMHYETEETPTRVYHRNDHMGRYYSSLREMHDLVAAIKEVLAK